MSYRNPTSQVDTSLSDSFIKKINKLGEDIRTTSTNASMMAQARKNANLKLVNQIENNVENLIGQAQDKLISENLEADGFSASLQEQAIAYKKASLNLATKGDYAERASDLATKSNFQNYTKRLPTDIAAFNTTAEAIKQAKLKGFSGGAGSIDMYETSPAYLASEAIESGQEDGIVTYESRINPKTKQIETVKVARGESIREANKQMNIDGDEYVLWSGTLKKAQTGPNASQYNLGVASITPGIYNGEGGLKANFIEEGIYNKNGILDERFKGEPITVIKSDDVGRYPVQVRNYNIAMMSEEMKPAVDAKIQSLASINNQDVNSLVRSLTTPRTIDGVTQFFFKPVKMEGGQPVRDESGALMYEEEIQVGNAGRIGKKFNEENNDTYGYTPSDFELIKKIALQETLDKSGAYNSPTEEYKIEKQYIAEEKPTVAKVTQGERQEQMRMEKIENAVGDLSSTNYGAITERLTRLNNLNGSGDIYQVLDKNKPHIIKVTNPNKIAGYEQEISLDLKDLTKVEEQLFNRYKVGKTLYKSEESSGNGSTSRFNK